MCLWSATCPQTTCELSSLRSYCTAQQDLELRLQHKFRCSCISKVTYEKAKRCRYYHTTERFRLPRSNDECAVQVEANLADIDHTTSSTVATATTTGCTQDDLFPLSARSLLPVTCALTTAGAAAVAVVHPFAVAALSRLPLGTAAACATRQPQEIFSRGESGSTSESDTYQIRYIMRRHRAGAEPWEGTVGCVVGDGAGGPAWHAFYCECDAFTGRIGQKRAKDTRERRTNMIDVVQDAMEIDRMKPQPYKLEVVLSLSTRTCSTKRMVEKGWLRYLQIWWYKE